MHLGRFLNFSQEVVRVTLSDPRTLRKNENLHPWVNVDQAGRSLPPKTLCILAGLALKLIPLCN